MYAIVSQFNSCYVRSSWLWHHAVCYVGTNGCLKRNCFICYSFILKWVTQRSLRIHNGYFNSWDFFSLQDHFFWPCYPCTKLYSEFHGTSCEDHVLRAVLLTLLFLGYHYHEKKCCHLAVKIVISYSLFFSSIPLFTCTINCTTLIIKQ
jgi:hypothetical protein